MLSVKAERKVRDLKGGGNEILSGSDRKLREVVV